MKATNPLECYTNPYLEAQGCGFILNEYDGEWEFEFPVDESHLGSINLRYLKQAIKELEELL